MSSRKGNALHVVGTDTLSDFLKGGGNICDYHQNQSQTWRGRSEGVPHPTEKEIEH